MVKTQFYFIMITLGYRSLKYFFNMQGISFSDINDCDLHHCQNNGICTDLVNDYRCECVTGFNGTYCEISKQINL